MVSGGATRRFLFSATAGATGRRRRQKRRTHREELLLERGHLHDTARDTCGFEGGVGGVGERCVSARRSRCTGWRHNRAGGRRRRRRRRIRAPPTAFGLVKNPRARRPRACARARKRAPAREEALRSSIPAYCPIERVAGNKEEAAGANARKTEGAPQQKTSRSSPIHRRPLQSPQSIVNHSSHYPLQRASR